ncbi:hypothetical protein BG011_009988 [Mortierella polycephala]|uniref:CCHC-type domain-containing protein n=1 Tax=Mortierella polycephala TaxID=41804 RepID=A0A9P6PNE9_9FUNG|nr:hypothetical protein BG011_009988 [Mortierella polycephala]
MSTWNPAYSDRVFLYRVLRVQDNPSEGLHPTSPSACLTIKDHVERGGYDVFKRSQFISTTQHLDVAITWAINKESTLVVIFCRHLDPSVTLYDLSKGHHSLSEYYNRIVQKHGEVLVRPEINSSAMEVYSYDRLLQINATYLSSNLRQNVLSNWVLETALDRLYSYQCTFCNESGHDVECGHHCLEYEDLEAIEAIEQSNSYHCDICDESGHDVDDCPKYKDWEAEEEAIERSDYCEICHEFDHDIYDCPEYEDWETEEEEAIEQSDSYHCDICDESGHDIDDCPKYKDWEAEEEAIERSDYCEICHEFDHDFHDCPEYEDWEAEEEAIEQSNSYHCDICDESGHDIDECPKYKDWRATEEAIEQSARNPTVMSSVNIADTLRSFV